MARSKSSSGYPDSFNSLVVTVGKLQKEVRIETDGVGLKVNGLRTTLQCFFAAVKREGMTPNADRFTKERGMYAEKVIVRAEGDCVVISHRDTDKMGLLVSAAIDAAIARTSEPEARVNSSEAAERAGLSEARGQSTETTVANGLMLKARESEWSEADENARRLHEGRKAEDRRAPVAESILAELVELPPATDSALPGITTAPGSMLDMVSAENTAPRPAVDTPGQQKYTRQDGRAYPEQEDGEPTWGFNADGEPKLNQFF